MAIRSYLNIICEVFNNVAIPALIDINGDHFAGITDYPQMTHGDVEDANLENLGKFIHQMVGCGALIPDEGLEDFIRDAAGMPERLEDWDGKEDTSASDGGTNQNNPAKSHSSNVSPDDDLDTEEEDAEDLEKAKKARRRLGRSEM